MLRRTCSIGLMGVLLLTALVRADGLIVVDQPVLLPRPEGRPHPVFAPLHVEEHRVEVVIRDQVAVTTVNQVFVNPTNRRLEGTYLFPLPAGAQIDRFSMDIDGKPVEAELLDADKARKIYEDIVRRMQDPALMEYMGQGLFRVRIFPIEPRGRKHVTLKYTQVLRSDNGTVGYLYPLNTEKFSSAPLKTVSIKVDVKCSDPIKGIYSPSHPVELRRHGDRHAVVGFEDRDVRPDTDFQLYFTPHRGDGPIGLSVLTYHDGKRDPTGAAGGYFLLLASPGLVQDQAAIVPKDIVFVLDTSGSMSGGKLDQARRALRFCLDNLNRHDRFEVIRFSTEVEPLFGKLVEAGDEPRKQAAEFIAAFRPMGGTAIHEALRRAADVIEPADAAEPAARPRFVVFLTDGRPTIGQTNIDRILEDAGKAFKRSRVFSFGIGADVNTHLLDRLSEQARGTTQYVLPEEDIEIKLSNFYSKIANPVLADVTLTFSSDLRVSAMYPSQLPDLFTGDQLILFGRYTGDGGDVAITLEGSVNGKRRSFTHEAAFARPGKGLEHDFIPRLWATRRVGHLLDEIRLRGENAELRDEVTQLARHFGIVTPYTSYLIVEDETRRNVPVTRQSMSGLQADRERLEIAGRSYRGMRDATTGMDAVGGAASNQMLREAVAAAPSNVAADALARRGMEDGQAARWRSQAVRIVQGRAFYQNGEQWVDAAVQSRPNAPVERVTFNSTRYYELLALHPHSANWLSVGRNVQLLLGDTVYEIVDGEM